MKKTLSTEGIARELSDGFSYPAARALAEWMEEYEEGTGEEMELDTVAIRCEWGEYSDLAEWAHDYFSNAWEELGFDPEEYDEDDFDSAIRDYINDRGTLIEYSGGILVSAF